MAKINDLCRGAGLAELILRNVTDKFADKDFDGAPVRIKESKQDDKLSEEIITGILTSYRSLDFFLQTWNDAEKKLAENVRKRNYWTKYGDKAQYLRAIRELEAEIYSAA